MSDADDDMDKPVTGREMHAAFADFHGGMKNLLAAFFANNAEEHAATRAFLAAEIARHTKANAEQSRIELGAVDDKYKDLPDRVTKLEAAVFPAPPTKRQRRR